MFLGASQDASQAKSTRNIPKTLGIDESSLVTNEEFKGKWERLGQLMG